jgi:hypothetical protein
MRPWLSTDGGPGPGRWSLAWPGCCCAAALLLCCSPALLLLALLVAPRAPRCSGTCPASLSNQPGAVLLRVERRPWSVAR